MNLACFHRFPSCPNPCQSHTYVLLQLFTFRALSCRFKHLFPDFSLNRCLYKDDYLILVLD